MIITISIKEIKDALGVSHQYIRQVQRGQKNLHKKRHQSLIKLYEAKINEMQQSIKELT